MEEEIKKFMIRGVLRDEWDEAMEVVWKTFLKFEAPDYTDIGIKSFNDFITDSMLHRLFVMGSYQMFGAYLEGKMIGVISLRGKYHISLLFVEEKYHKRGIGRALVQYLSNYLASEMGIYKLTVNASPYGVKFYHKLGFRDVEEETEKDGIIYTPMELIM